MTNSKEECKMLTTNHAVVLVLDYFTEDRTPVIVLRRVVDYGSVRISELSVWYVRLDAPLKDGSDCVLPGFVLGYKTELTLDFYNLAPFLDSQCFFMPPHERRMLFLDAICRLREAAL